MARQPFFSGDYGSSLAQIDTRPIMQGAAAQAAAYQGIGQNIGGAIEKYGLMKEQQKKDKGFLKGAITGIKSLKEGDPNPQNDMMYDAIIAGAEDENIPLAQRVAQTKQGQQQINLTGQQNMQQSLISSRQATEEAQREKLKLIQQSEAARKALNMSLFKEQREYANIYDNQGEGSGGVIPTGRAKWVMNLPESLLESNALPMNRGIYDPEAARYRDLQMGLSEFRHEQAKVTAEQAQDAATAYPAGDRATDARRKAKEDFKGTKSRRRYQEKMTEGLTAGIPIQEAITKEIAAIDSEAKRIVSGAAWSKDDEGKSLKLEDMIDYNPITEGIVLSDKASGFASQDFDRLKHLVKRKGDLRLDQKIQVVMTDGSTKEMTGREFQRFKAEKEAKEAERLKQQQEYDRREAAHLLDPRFGARNEQLIISP